MEQIRSKSLYRMLQSSTFSREEICVLTQAYTRALHTLGLVDRGDPLSELLARKILEARRTGIRDPAAISAVAIRELGIR
jgi:hypothetical protein